MDLAPFTYDVFEETGYFYVFVKVGRDRVGELKANRMGNDQACLSEIRMQPDWKRIRSWRERLFRKPFQKFEFVDFQNRGIGTELLQKLSEWCSRNKIREVYGSIVESDLNKTPQLIEWYRKRGFHAFEPDGRSLRDAVMLVIWRESFAGERQPRGKELSRSSMVNEIPKTLVR